MTELAIRDETAIEVAAPAAYPMPPTRLTAWANDARQANLAAVSLARTAFVPASLRGKHQDEAIAEQITVSQITAAILTGQEVGLEPMAALRSIDIIEGTPAMRAHALRGVVQGHGHEIWVEESTDTRAVVCGKRKGSTVVQRSTWTIDRAKKMNLAHKQNWTKQPAAMLVARATSEVCRWVGGDALLGMPYSVEELADGEAEATYSVEQLASDPPAKPTRKIARKQAAPADPPEEPSLEEMPPVAPVAPTGDLVSPDQLGLMHKLFTELGMKDREARLNFTEQIVGRMVPTSTELTRTEASKLINSLQASADAAGDEPPFDDEPVEGEVAE